MTEKRVRSRLRTWRRRLNLTDWRIRLRFRQLQDAYATCDWDENERIAEIVMRPPATFSTDRECEMTLVHELLHLLLDGHLPAERHADDTARERAIRTLERALTRP